MEIDEWDGNFVSASASMRFQGRSRLRELVTTHEHPDIAQVGGTPSGLVHFKDDVDRVWADITAERQQLHPEWPALERPAPDSTMPQAE
jgi:hypothetical protein